ncbi:MAG: hypothetical protein GYB31_08005 [Bacteroidetes bacterium]|nr:hypothetical protein [Bacteroidota bacterium]
MNSIKKAGHILFFLAGLLLVLHNITPHFHHGELSEAMHEEDHKDADTLLDWIRLGFHNDLGEGHLEWFTQTDADLDGASDIFAFFGLVPDPDFCLSAKAPRAQNLIDFYYQPLYPPESPDSGISLRGPPVFA